jgi:glyceraldehyde-3-phosphate dehydrogenase (NADP+)
VQPANGIESIFPAESGIPENYRPAETVEQTEYLIDGELRHWNGPRLDVFSPVCVHTQSGLEQLRIGSYPRLSEKEALEALEASVRAYDHGRGKWPTMSTSERIAHIQDFVCRMKARKQEVVRLLMWEIGKSCGDSEKEFDRTITYIEDTVDALKDLDRISSRFTIEQSIIGQIRRAPLGVVLCMGPFNYPLNETFTLLLPALIMGNTVIFKPPRFGVLLHRPLLEAFHEALPRGVVNAIYGEGRIITPPLMASGKIDALGFIGTSQAADTLKKSHPKPHRLRCVLGLEAKNPAIILKDADLDLAVKECVLGTLSFNGQRCTALKILFVHSSIADDFLSRFCTAVAALKCGMPWDDGVGITPLPEKNKPQYLTDLVNDACNKGARAVNKKGGIVEATFFHPAVVYPVRKEMRLWDEEQFGPVIPVASFTTSKSRSATLSSQTTDSR